MFDACHGIVVGQSALQRMTDLTRDDMIDGVRGRRVAAMLAALAAEGKEPCVLSLHADRRRNRRDRRSLTPPC